VSKRPAWYHPIERAKYDGARTSYDDFQAKLLDDNELDQYDVDIPVTWRKQPLQWLSGNQKSLPAGSGAGLVQSPYADIYTKVYGVVPIADLPKYRMMYRNFPDVQQAIEMQVNLALGKGFVIEHKNKKVAEYLEDIMYEINLQESTPTMGRDMLTYGNSFTEVQWDETEEVKEQMYDVNGSVYTKGELQKYNLPTSGIKAATFVDEGKVNKNFVATKFVRKPKSDLVGLKPLDPVYMRVRRDSWGNVFGYVQWMSFPPVLVDANTCIHIKHRPTSTGYESAYGVSLLMSLVKNTDLLTYFENDAAVWTHYKAVPPLTIKGGTPEKPYTTDQMKDLMKLLRSRSASSMIFVKGDVTIEEMKTVAADLHLDWWIDYLLLKRNQALGVPSFLMGQKEIGGRSTAQVLVQDFITRLQVLQGFVSRPIEQFLFRPLIDEKFGKSVPNARIVWKPIVEESPDMRTQRLVQLLQAGALSINEVRVESGFNALSGEQYEKPKDPMQILGNPTGFPAKPGAPGGKPKLPNEQKVPQNTPESKMKSNPKTAQEERIKRFQLMKMDNEFREKMIDLASRARFEFSQDEELVKDIKDKYLAEAKKVINTYITASYMLNLEEMCIGDADVEPMRNMKDGIYSSFSKTIEEMVKAKEEGEL
jgi:hypothetical protein